VGIQRAVSPEGEIVLRDPVARFALVAETGFLQLAHHGDGEGVVDLHYLHVLGAVSRQLERLAGGAARQAFRLAGVGPKDVDVMEIYDSFTITVICELEESGFCKKGEGADWVAAHSLRFDGDKPLNTHGGQLSYGQASTAGGCAQVTEAVRQIRRDGGEHQVPGPTDVIYVTGSGGAFSQQGAMVLGSAATV
jgi:acetyl-CoA acetyltransferase